MYFKSLFRDIVDLTKFRAPGVKTARHMGRLIESQLLRILATKESVWELRISDGALSRKLEAGALLPIIRSVRETIRVLDIDLDMSHGESLEALWTCRGLEKLHFGPWKPVPALAGCPGSGEKFLYLSDVRLFLSGVRESHLKILVGLCPSLRSLAILDEPYFNTDLYQSSIVNVCLTSASLINLTMLCPEMESLDLAMPELRSLVAATISK